MKAIKTIVATAVIALAATTVAMAGVQHLGPAADDGPGAGPAQAAPAPQTVAQQVTTPGSVPLTAAQFAALLRAASRDDGVQAGTHRQQADHTRKNPANRKHRTTRHAALHSTTHQATTHHTTTHRSAAHTATQHSGTQAGSHHGESHDGGCD
jgi:hypothetical protein